MAFKHMTGEEWCCGTAAGFLRHKSRGIQDLWTECGARCRTFYAPAAIGKDNTALASSWLFSYGEGPRPSNTCKLE